MAAGSIVFELLARTARFETDTKRAEKRMAEMKKEAAELGKTLGVAVVAGAAAMTYALKQSIDAMDGISKSAQKVGTTTEALSELQYAAGLSDVSVEELDKSMAKLAKNAAEGNDAFTAMGISTKDASGNVKDTSDLLKEVAGKMANYKDGAEKTALAQELFGKSGADLIPLLNSGADGLAEMAKEASQFGLVVGGDVAKQAEEFNDTLTRIGGVGKGLVQTVAANMLPAFQSLADGLLDSAKNGGLVERVSSGLTTVLKTLTGAVVFLGGSFNALGKLLGNMAGFLVDTFLDAIGTASNTITGLGLALRAAATGDFTEAGRLIGETMSGVSDAAERMAGGFSVVVSDFADDMSKTAALVDGVWNAQAKKVESNAPDTGKKFAAPLVKGVDEARKAKEKLAKEAEAARKKMEDEGKKLIEAMRTPLEKMRAEQQTAGKLGAGGFIDPETQRRAIAKAANDYEVYINGERAKLVDGLLSEEEEIKASYQRRIDAINALQDDAATGGERDTAVAALEQKRDEEIAKAKVDRYRDLLSEQEQLDLDYSERKKKILEDRTLTEEEQINYVAALYDGYMTKVDALEAEQRKKREESSKAQIELASAGFGGAAEIAKVFAGEQSAEYQALFAASKAFALADITIKQSQAIAKAWGENNYWTAAGLTLALAGQFAGLISSVSGSSFGGTRADGGPVNEGRSYLVGERGPEMFTPSTGGSIVPNSALQSQQAAPQFRIVNAFDDGHIDDYLGSDKAEQKIVNAVRRNKRALGFA